MQNVHEQHSETFTSGNCKHCAKCAHIQHSERPSYQGPDDTVQDVCNILRDLQVRGLMALLKMCTQNILKDLHFRELVVFSWKMKNVKEGCLVLIMVFIQIGLLTMTQNKV
jgi:hypothetical protein